MLPTPNINQSLNEWIDTQESKEILSLLQLWIEKDNYEELTGILLCLKDNANSSLSNLTLEYLCGWKIHIIFLLL